MKRNAPQTVKTLRAITAAAAKVVERKSRRSMNGSGCRDSWRRKPTNAHAAAAAVMITHGCVQPRPGLSIMTNTRPKRLPVPRNCPSRSVPRPVEVSLSGTSIAHATTAAAPIGRLIQNTPRQPTVSMSKPPTMGPRASAAPNTAPQMPIARARSVGSTKTWLMIANATGFIIEAPTACINRAAMRTSMVGARLHSSEPSMKTVVPICRTRRRPNLSPASPPSNCRDATPSA